MTTTTRTGSATASRAADLPVARVAVDIPLAHLDRPFDYAVPAPLGAAAVPGVRVRVRFAGRIVDGFVLDRVEDSDHVGRLASLEKVVSAEPVLSPEVAGFARALADRYAGTLADVLRLAVPPRHARVEAERAGAARPSALSGPSPPPPAPSVLQRYDGGDAYLGALAAGSSPRVVWTALPGPAWPAELAAMVQATLAGGRGAVVVAPDARDVERLDAALTAALGERRHVVLRADLGPAERYRRWLAVRRREIRAVVGTRAAVFAPVADIGLVAVWDDGDDLHAEPRAPYPHVREAAMLRAHRAGAAALLGSFTTTVEAAGLLSTGWARRLAAPRRTVRLLAPRVEAAGGDADVARDPAARSARLPSLAFDAARAALAAGAPVLVQVPRRGYQPGLACARCRAPARCANCRGPLGRTDGASAAAPVCRWCGRPAVDWCCPGCASTVLRAVVVGAGRTAEELGRAFPGVRVRTSASGTVLPDVPDQPALIVATPGAEPVAAAGYGAVLLLDGWALLGRPDLRAGEETLRRWMAAAALARAAAEGGRVIVMAEAALPVVQALVRWDPAGAAARETADRVGLGFPPAVRLASLSGSRGAVTDLLAATDLPVGVSVLGPVPLPVPAGRGADEPPEQRALVRVPRCEGVALATALKKGLAVRSAAKAPEAVRVQLDPPDLL